MTWQICGPAATAPTVTHLVAKCAICGAQWQVKSPNLDDARGCSFCDAPARAVSVVSEAPTFGEAVIYGGGDA